MLFRSVFAQALGLDSVSIDDSFLDLGGNSLLAMRLWGRLKATLGGQLELKQILDDPTVAAVARLLERDTPTPSVGARPSLVRRS